MSSRFVSSLICSTAIISCITASAFAGEAYLLPATRGTIERIAASESLQQTSGSSTIITPSPSTIVLPAARSVEKLPVIGDHGSSKNSEPLRKAAAPSPRHTRIAEDSPAKPAPAVASEAPQPTVAAPEPASATPASATASIAPVAEAPVAPAPAPAQVTASDAPAAPTVSTEPSTTASVPASTPTATAESPATATPATPAAPATATASEPASSPAAPPAPVVASAPVPAVPAPAAPATADVTAPAPATAETPAQASTPAPAAPTVAATPAETMTSPAPAPAAPAAIAVAPGLTIDAVSAALKTAVEQQFVVRPQDEKKLGAENRKIYAAILAFYTTRNFAPLWVDTKGFDTTAASAMERLQRAHEDGLNDADYAVAPLKGEPTAESLASAEVKLTLATLKYARQAQAGRFDPGRLSDQVTPKLAIPDPAKILDTLATTTDASASLEAFNPPQEGYKRLKAALAKIEDAKPAVAQAPVPGGPTIRPGAKDTRIAMLRERLGVEGTATADDANFYDPSLVEAVKSFQKTRGLKPSGLIGPQTIDAFNAAPNHGEPRAADIIANMERWRWLPRDLGETYVMVNVPDFSLTVVHDGVVTHKAKAIVGRVANPTPIFSETMTHIIVNPYWNVPYSIVKKEYLAKAQETNGAALERGNFEVEVGNKTVDPTSVDWANVNASQIHLRQRPGAGNALGNIKFMFPNQHSVYIHDTSSRGLFVQDYRSLSHGCVRVQDPFSFADALLSQEPTGLTGAKLKAMIGGSEKYLWLKRPIPVHIAYFTVFVDDAGKLQSRPDLYGHNARTKQLLGL